MNSPVGVQWIHARQLKARAFAKPWISATTAGGSKPPANSLSPLKWTNELNYPEIGSPLSEDFRFER